MIEINQNSSVPLYDQIKAGLTGLVVRGLLRPGDRAPSVRVLAGELRVNPNTVARALRELVEEGVLEARRGEGCFVAAQAARRSADARRQAAENLKTALELAARSGLSRREIEEIARRTAKEEI